MPVNQLPPAPVRSANEFGARATKGLARVWRAIGQFGGAWGAIR